MANSFDIKLVKADKGTRPGFVGDSVKVSFAEAKKGTLYTAGMGLGKDGKSLVSCEIYEDGRKRVKIYNPNGKLNFLLEGKKAVEEDGYIFLDAQELKVFPNGKVTLQITGGEVKKIEVSAADIVVTKKEGEKIVLSQKEPINLMFPTTFFDDLMSEKITVGLFPSQMFEMLREDNKKPPKDRVFKGVEVNEITGEYKEKGKKKSKSFQFITIGEGENKRLYIRNGSSFQEIKREESAVIHGIDGESHDIGFRFHGGPFETDKLITSAMLTKNLTEDSAGKIINYVSERVGKDAIKRVSRGSYSTWLLDIKKKRNVDKKQILGVAIASTKEPPLKTDSRGEAKEIDVKGETDVEGPVVTDGKRETSTVEDSDKHSSDVSDSTVETGDAPKVETGDAASTEKEGEDVARESVEEDSVEEGDATEIIKETSESGKITTEDSSKITEERAIDDPRREDVEEHEADKKDDDKVIPGFSLKDLPGPVSEESHEETDVEDPVVTDRKRETSTDEDSDSSGKVDSSDVSDSTVETVDAPEAETGEEASGKSSKKPKKSGKKDKSKKGKKEKTGKGSDVLSAPGFSKFQILKHVLGGLSILALIAVGVLAMLSGFLLPAFISFSMAIGFGGIFTAELTNDYKKHREDIASFNSAKEKMLEKDLSAAKTREAELDREIEAATTEETAESTETAEKTETTAGEPEEAPEDEEGAEEDADKKASSRAPEEAPEGEEGAKAGADKKASGRATEGRAGEESGGEAGPDVRGKGGKVNPKLAADISSAHKEAIAIVNEHFPVEGSKPVDRESSDEGLKHVDRESSDKGRDI